ncbi:MAG TPA: glycosyltransferase family 2 protein [Pengzhenrongella sp.]
MTADAAIDILLATHDGERHVADQVASILAQSHPGWTLTVRDDGSTDGTLRVVRELADQNPDRMTVTARASASGSAKQNFLEMLVASRARYVMFADPDDVWHPDKVARTLARMTELEARLGADTPLLVHTDLTVTDANLYVTAASMVHAQQLDGTESRLARLSVQNTVTGCTVMVNRALAELVVPPFDAVAMHDWWLAMMASAFGAIGFVDSPTVLYRQHGGNAVGARPSRSLAYKVNRLLDKEGVRDSLRASFAQADAFLAQYSDRLSAEQTELLRAYVSIPALGKVGRVLAIRRHGFWKNTTARRLGQLLYV